MVKMTYVRSEVNPEFAAIVLPGDLVIVVRCNIEIEGVGGHMSLCIPYSTIEPIRDKFYGGLEDSMKDNPEWKRRLRTRIQATMIDVTVELGTAQITADRLLDLKVGDVIQLEQKTTDNLVGRVQGIPKFKGRPGTIQASKAFKVEKMCIGN